MALGNISISAVKFDNEPFVRSLTATIVPEVSPIGTETVAWSFDNNQVWSTTKNGTTYTTDTTGTYASLSTMVFYVSADTYDYRVVNYSLFTQTLCALYYVSDIVQSSGMFNIVYDNFPAITAPVLYINKENTDYSSIFYRSTANPFNFTLCAIAQNSLLNVTNYVLSSQNLNRWTLNTYLTAVTSTALAPDSTTTTTLLCSIDTKYKNSIGSITSLTNTTPATPKKAGTYNVTNSPVASGYTVAGIGTNLSADSATFQVVVNSLSAVTGVTVLSAGFNFGIGDIITVNNAALGLPTDSTIPPLMFEVGSLINNVHEINQTVTLDADTYTCSVFAAPVSGDYVYFRGLNQGDIIFNIDQGLSYDYGSWGTSTVDFVPEDLFNTRLPVFNTGTGFNGEVFAVAPYGTDKFFVGGNFTSYNGTSANRLALLSSDGSLVTSWMSAGSGFNGYVRTIQVSGEKIYAGGNFSTYNLASADRLICLDSNASINSGFNTQNGGFNGVVRTIAFSGDRIFVGGEFTSYKGVTRNYIACLSSTGGLVSNSVFNPPTTFNAAVKTIVLDLTSNRVYVGGDFTLPYYYIACLESNGAATSPTFWQLNYAPTAPYYLNGSVSDMVLDYQRRLLITGTFQQYYYPGTAIYTTIGGVGRLNTNGSLDTTYNAGGVGFDAPYSSINKIIKYTPNDDKVYVGGFYNPATPYTFTQYNNQPNNIGLIRLNSDGTKDTDFVNGNGFTELTNIRAIALSGTNIIVGGSFNTYKGRSAGNIVQINNTGKQSVVADSRVANWRRCTATFTLSNPLTSQIALGITTDYTSVSSPATPNNSSVLLWGAQINRGVSNTLTSYVSTLNSPRTKNYNSSWFSLNNTSTRIGTLPLTSTRYSTLCSFNAAVPTVSSVQVYISANSTFDSAYPWYTPHTITRSITGKFVTSFLTADFIGFPTAYFNPYGQQVRGLDFLANYTTSPGMCFYGEGHTELFKLSAKNNTNIQNYIWTIGNDSTGYYNLTAITAGAGTFNVNIPTVLDLYPNIPITLVVTESANPGLSAGPFYYFDDTTGQQLPYPFYYSTKNLSGTENSLNNKFKQSIQVIGYTPPASSFSPGISGNSIFLPTNGVARLYNAYLRVSLSGYQVSTLDPCYDKYNLSWKWSTFEGCATNPTAFSNMASSWVTMQSAISAGSGNVYPAAYNPVYFTSTQLSALSGKYAKLWRSEGASTLSAEKLPITSYGSSIVWTLCTSKWAVQQVNPNTQTDYTFPLQSFTNGSTPYTASTYEDTPVEINVAQTITSVICAEPFDWLQKQYVYTDSGATNIISPGDFRIYTNNRYVLTGSLVNFENISLGFNDVDRIVIDLGNGTTTTLTGDQIYNNFSTTYATTGPKTLIATTYYIASRSVSPAVDTFTDIVEVISNYDTVDPEKYLTQETVLNLPWSKIPLVAPNDWAVEDNINSVFKKFYENLEYLDNRGNCYSSEPTEYSGWLGTIPININGTSNCPLWTWEDVDCLAGGQDVAWEDTQQINDNFPTITTTGILASCALWDQHICSTAVLNPDCYGKYGIEWKWKSRKASSSSTTVTWKSTRVNSGYAKKWKLEPWINSDGEVITGQACDEGQWNVNIPKLSAYREPIVNCDSVSKCIYKNITSKDNILYVSLNNEIKLLSSDYSTTFLTSRLLIDDVNTFRSIKGLSLDTNGKLFVLDDVLNKVASYNIEPTSPIPFETYLSWGGYGSAESKYGFLRPNDLHVDLTNNIWITDTGNKCVKKYSNTGTWLLTITDTAFASFEPISTSVDSSGYIHILTTQEVRVYDATGSYSSSYYFNDQTDSTPIKINTNYNHEIIYIVFSTQVLKYFKNGTFAGYLINNKQCATDINDVWQDEFRNVLVTSGDKIIKFVDLMTPKTIKGPLTDNYWSLSDLYINKDEYIQNWVYNKSFQRLWDNIEIFRQSLIFDNSACGSYVGPIYAKDKIVIGLNEIVTSAVINRNISYLWQNFITLLNYFDPQCRKTSLNP